MLENGLYEQIIYNGLEEELSESEKLCHTAPIDSAEAAKILSKYIAKVAEKGLMQLQDNGGDLHDQIEMANRMIRSLQEDAEKNNPAAVSEWAEQLLSLVDPQNTIQSIGKDASLIHPVTSIAQTNLFTGAVHEPQMYSELKKEIISCNRIDMLVSFIKWSGLRLIMDELRQFTENGGQLRVITTSYMGATDVKAIEELRSLPSTQIKVSYDTKTHKVKWGTGNMKLTEKNGWIYLGNETERYVLGQPGIRNMLVFGVNPSTAVPEKDDPTIRKVRKFTSIAEYDGWIMVNLYPQITSNPEELHRDADKKLLSNNLEYLKQLQEKYRIDAVWAAWGDAIDIRPYLGKVLVEIQDALDGDFQWYYRGKKTRKGNPRHPLYMKEEENFSWFPVFDYATWYM